jgi:hypothetical protein
MNHPTTPAPNLTALSDPQAAARDVIAAAIHREQSSWPWSAEPEYARDMWRRKANDVLAAIAAAGLVITAPDAPVARPAGDRVRIDWTNDPITRSDIKKWRRALHDLRQTYYHPGIGMHPPYYRRCRSGYLRALRHLRLTGDHNLPLVTPAPDAPASGTVCISERDLYEIRDALRYLPFEHRKRCVAAIDAALAAAGSDPA